MANQNGFADMSEILRDLEEIPKKTTTQESLKAAADSFVKALIPNIPRSLFKKKHMADNVHVEVGEEGATVYFGETSFYWRFLEHGTAGKRPIKARHFVERTYDAHKEEIETILTKKIIEEMER